MRRFEPMGEILGLDPRVGGVIVLNAVLIVLWLVYSVARARMRGDL